MNNIITISRQYGSGGSEIGRILAERLGIPFYDNDIITQIAKENPFQDSSFNKEEDYMANSLIYSIAMGINTYNLKEFGGTAMTMEDQIYMNQSAVIRSIAKEGPCVIVGRCADYILEDEENVMKFYIWASIENRIRRAKEIYGDSHAKAQENILRIDKKRSSYYKYHSGKKWGHYINYDGILRSDLFGIEGTVNILEQMIMTNERELIGEDLYV